jgi:hypothetical protein
MNMEPKTRPTLRDLPLPAKLVVTVFLISVGLGYSWALLQLHFKHASKSNYLPTPSDVVARFSGKPWPLNDSDAKAQPKAEEPKENPLGKFAEGVKLKSLIKDRCAVCHSDEGGELPHFNGFDDLAKFFDPKPSEGKMHKLLTAPEDAPWGKDSSMRPAFGEKGYIGDEEWKKEFPKLKPDEQQKVMKERESERLVLVCWLEAGAPRDAYEKDAYKPEKPPAPIVETRESKAKKRQLSVDSLTQSTHAHLLSFSMLWALTGLAFAFTSYPLWMRAGIAPVVLIAQIAEIFCWWLGRLPDVGPYFALSVIGLGGIVGLGLAVQIVLSLFNMYGCKGKIVLLLLALAFGAGGGIVFTKYVQPHINAEKDS